MRGGVGIAGLTLVLACSRGSTAVPQTETALEVEETPETPEVVEPPVLVSIVLLLST